MFFFQLRVIVIDPFSPHNVLPDPVDATGKRIAQKPTPPHKIAKMVMYDSAVRYHLYDRPILIRDHDNTWRTATWEERRRVENSKRYVLLFSSLLLLCFVLFLFFS
jgi:hypothetical protein